MDLVNDKSEFWQIVFEICSSVLIVHLKTQFPPADDIWQLTKTILKNKYFIKVLKSRWKNAKYDKTNLFLIIKYG